MHIDPIEQFQIKNLVPLLTVGGHQIAFTNSAAYMLIIIALVTALLVLATARRAVIPGRLQSVAEMSYEFIGTTLRNST
ncbi:MAG: F0F1 ATP synthase subunit A, partial [Xanthobacteraceae bacterium]